jgi:hypothetical protein
MDCPEIVEIPVEIIFPYSLVLLIFRGLHLSGPHWARPTSLFSISLGDNRCMLQQFPVFWALYCKSMICTALQQASIY